MFICCECNKKTKEKDRVFQTSDWCRSCVDIETQRSIKQDTVSGYSRKRPPKYMLQKCDYKQFGY